MGKGRQQVIDKLRKLLEDRDAISVSDRVIFCRNVMIYFDKPTQQELINRFWDYLEPGGHLFVGHSGGAFRRSSTVFATYGRRCTRSNGTSHGSGNP